MVGASGCYALRRKSPEKEQRRVAPEQFFTLTLKPNPKAHKISTIIKAREHGADPNVSL